MNVAEAVGRAVARFGPKVAFGEVGSGNYEHVTALCDEGMEYFAARHEAVAAMMADGYARLSGDVGVVSVHQGPGFTNVLTPLGEAVKSGSPVLVLAPEVPYNSRFGNQKIGQDELSRIMGARVHRIRSTETAVADVLEALRVVRATHAPVVFLMPIDLQREEYSGPSLDTFAPLRAIARPVPAQETVVELAEFVASAERLVFVAGRGAIVSGAGAEIKALADEVGALVAVSSVAKGMFSGNPRDLGISGIWGTGPLEEVLPQADAVLVLGATFNELTTRNGKLLAPDVRIAQVDIDAERLGSRRPVDLAVVGDVAETVSALRGELKSRGGRRTAGWSQAVLDTVASRAPYPAYDDVSNEETMDPRTAVIALDELLPQEKIVTIGAGHFMGWPAQFMSVPDEHGWVFPGAFMSTGLGVGIALGVSIARPDRLTVAVDGDGCFVANLASLDVAVRYNAPILIAILNDAAYGAELFHAEKLGISADLSLFPDTDFAAIARSFGAEGVTVRQRSDFAAVEKWLADRTGPMVVDIKINPTVNSPWEAELGRASTA